MINFTTIKTKFKLTLFIIIVTTLVLLLYYNKNVLNKTVGRFTFDGKSRILSQSTSVNISCENKDYLHVDLYHDTRMKKKGMFRLTRNPKMQFRPEGTDITKMSAPFTPQMTKSNYEKIEKLLQIWIDVTSEVDPKGDCFMMAGGTVLGSYRHMGLIPWDDDFDINCNIDCVPRIKEKLKEYSSVIDFTNGSEKMKVYGKLDNVETFHTSSYGWNWPYLDVSFFNVNATHFREIPYTYGRYFHYKKELIMPFVLRPFGKFWLPAPRNSLAYIKETYGEISECSDGGYSHILEAGRRHSVQSCSKLMHLYPFVNRKIIEKIPNKREKKDKIIWIKEILEFYDPETATFVPIKTICLPESLNVIES